jgi:hypothetical protein
MKTITIKKTKASHFRAWKSGKSWVFASTLLVFAGVLSLGTKEAAADTTTLVAASGSAASAPAAVSNAITSDDATIASLQAALSQAEVGSSTDISGMFGNVAKGTGLTQSYSASQTVTLSSNPSYAVNISAVASYEASYINALRASNGISTRVTVNNTANAVAQSVAVVGAAQKSLTKPQDLDSLIGNALGGSTIALGDGYGGSVSIKSLGIQSDQELAYYLVMSWYDDGGNEVAGYGHRATLLYGGTEFGAGVAIASNGGIYATQAFIEPGGYTTQDVALMQNVAGVAYNGAATALHPVDSKPLAKITFRYVDQNLVTKLKSALSAAKTQLATDTGQTEQSSTPNDASLASLLPSLASLAPNSDFVATDKTNDALLASLAAPVASPVAKPVAIEDANAALASLVAGMSLGPSTKNDDLLASLAAGLTPEAWSPANNDTALASLAAGAY